MSHARPHDGTTGSGRGRRSLVSAAILIGAALVGIGGGAGAFLLFGPNDSDSVEQAAPAIAPASPVAPTPTPVATSTVPQAALSPPAEDQPSQAPAPTVSVDPTPDAAAEREQEKRAAFQAVADEIAALPADELAPVSDRRAAETIRAEMESVGMDTTGMGVSVWSFTNDGTLLLLEVDDDSAIAADDTSTTVGEDVLLQLLQSDAVTEAKVVRLALLYRSADEIGPFELTATFDVAEALDAAAIGADLADGAIATQFERTSG